MSYFTVKVEAEDRFEEKKSIFIGSINRVYTEGEAKKFINKVRSREKEAKHNVYAYIIGENMDIQRYSDDGEPQGTAGIPILEVIKKNKLTDVVIVVTRYFGGILLGRGGLLRSYTKAASMSIDKSGVVEKTRGMEFDIIIPYEDVDKVKYIFEKKAYHIENIDYSDKVKISTYCEENKSDELINKIIDVTRGKCQVIVGDEEEYFKIGSRLYRKL